MFNNIIIAVNNRFFNEYSNPVKINNQVIKLKTMIFFKKRLRDELLSLQIQEENHCPLDNI
jgi:hypothetical protein